MFNTPVLGIVIGLVFIFLLYSLLASIIQEYIASKLSFRAKILEKAILRMLEDGTVSKSYRLGDRLIGLFHLLGKPNLLLGKEFAAWFYVHPLIRSLGEDNVYSKPAYLSAQSFSKVILDLLKGDAIANQFDQLNDSIVNGNIYPLPINVASDPQNRAVKAVVKGNPTLSDSTKVNASVSIKINQDTAFLLQTLWKDAGGDANKFKLLLEGWFDETMARSTGWYKRYTRYVLFIIGLTIAVGFNVDTISITKKLARDPQLREELVATAAAYSERSKALGERLNTAPTGTAATADLKQDYEKMHQQSQLLMDSANALIRTDLANVNKQLGLGWNGNFPQISKEQDLTCYFGWLITAFAISLGAPFWFDLLSKFMRLKNATSKEEVTNPAAAPPIPVTIQLNTQNSSGAQG